MNRNRQENSTQENFVKENFVCEYKPSPNPFKPHSSTGTKYVDNTSRCKPTQACFKDMSNPFRTAEVIVDKNYKSINNQLVGGQNPKTLIPPMITTPAYSLDWRDTTMTVPNMINGMTNQDLYRSGYLSQEFKQDKDAEYTHFERNENLASMTGLPEYKPHRRLNSTLMTSQRLGDDVIENYENQEVKHTIPTYGEKSWSDVVNTSLGYNKTQFENASFPANLPSGKALQNSDMTEYNRQLFTQTVQPGVQYRTEVAENANSNIGISFQQQFLPRTYTNTSDGGLLVTDHDPEFAPAPKTMIKTIDQPTTFNTYDPRFTGYGSSTRGYVDDVTGQPRFVYDDINAVKMPNYITRSKIDTHDFADMYGPVQNYGTSLNSVREMAQDAFFRDTEQFRNDITIGAMRKNNAIAWQRRFAPTRK